MFGKNNVIERDSNAMNKNTRKSIVFSNQYNERKLFKKYLETIYN